MMYRYAVSYVGQTQTNVRDTILQAKSASSVDNTQVSTSGTGEVYANDMKEARVAANEKFVDKTIKNILKEKTSGAFYA
ncbi:hypothetical protein [Acetobacter syzygii]|uniref:hypothetical protein n=1 Tax=Acetobacter syzygii TaxID=146476 RepID=UPI000AC718D1|nr:hypothetical protein [Acetobacter syzygii]